MEQILENIAWLAEVSLGEAREAEGVEVECGLTIHHEFGYQPASDRAYGKTVPAKARSQDKALHCRRPASHGHDVRCDVKAPAPAASVHTQGAIGYSAEEQALAAMIPHRS